eukprot:350436-Chlamydomonas_euryale.AAC.9
MRGLAIAFRVTRQRWLPTPVTRGAPQREAWSRPPSLRPGPLPLSPSPVCAPQPPGSRSLNFIGHDGCMQRQSRKQPSEQQTALPPDVPPLPRICTVVVGRYRASRVPT